MAAIKTKGIINSGEVSKELQLVINKMNELIVAMNKTQSTMKKGNTTRKQMSEAQKEQAAQAKKQAALEKQLAKQRDADFKNQIKQANQKIAAEKKLAATREKERQKQIDKINKERQKRLELIRAARMEIKTDEDLNNKLKAQRVLRGQLDRSTAKGEAQYRRMTKEIQHMAAAQDRNNKSMKVFNHNVGNYPKVAKQATVASNGFSKGMAGMAVAAGALVMAFRQVARVTKQSIDNFLVQEDINLKVANTFGEYSNQINNAANATQGLTRVGNEQYQKLAVLASNMGVANGQVNDTVRDSIGLAELFASSGLSQETAMKGLALARQGDYTQLQRYIPALKQATTEAEKQAILNDITAKGFDQAQKNAASYQGRLTQMKNAYGDLQEVVGGQVLGGLFDPNDSGIIDNINKVIAALEETEFITVMMESWAEPAKNFGELIQSIASIFGKTADAGDVLTVIFKVLTKTFQFATLPIKFLISGLQSLVDYSKSVYNIFSDLKNFKFEDVINLWKSTITTFLSPLTDLLGLTDELNSLLGTTGETLTKVSEQTKKYGTAWGDLDAEVQDFITTTKEQEEETKKLTEETEAQNEAVKEAKKAYEALNNAIKSINDEYKLQLALSEDKSIHDQAALTAAQATFDAYKSFFSSGGYTGDEIDKLKDLQQIITDIELSIENTPQIMKREDVDLLIEAKDKIEGVQMAMRDVEATANDVGVTFEMQVFDKLSQASNSFLGFWKTNGKAIELIVGSISDALSASYDNQITGIEATQEKNDAYYDNLIANYEGDEAAQAQLEQAKATQAEKTQNQIIALQRKKAIADKVTALFDIAVNTAVGISKAIAAANPILAAALGVAGAVQAGIVASTPLPQYRVGLDSADSDHVGIVGDAGRELVNYPDGSSALFDRPTKIFIPENTNILTHQETEAKLKNMQFTANLDKLNKQSTKQLHYLSVIAKNTSKQGRQINDRDINYITKLRK